MTIPRTREELVSMLEAEASSIRSPIERAVARKTNVGILALYDDGLLEFDVEGRLVYLFRE